jgi:hypothetical protein
MTDLVKQALTKFLEGVDDLDVAQAVFVRERVIRDTMAKTGEDRATVTDMLDALGSMDQEAVLDLTEGEPTTLRAALQRYVDHLETQGDTDSLDHANNLTTILAYPWPRITVKDEEGPNAHHSLIKMGDQVIGRINTDREGASVADDTAEIICRALQA